MTDRQTTDGQQADKVDLNTKTVPIDETSLDKQSLPDSQLTYFQQMANYSQQLKDNELADHANGQAKQGQSMKVNPQLNVESRPTKENPQLKADSRPTEENQQLKADSQPTKENPQSKVDSRSTEGNQQLKADCQPTKENPQLNVDNRPTKEIPQLNVDNRQSNLDNRQQVKPSDESAANSGKEVCNELGISSQSQSSVVQVKSTKEIAVNQPTTKEVSNELEIKRQSQTTVAQVQSSQDQTTVQMTNELAGNENTGKEVSNELGINPQSQTPVSRVKSANELAVSETTGKELSNELEISPQSQTTVAQVQPSQDQTTAQMTNELAGNEKAGKELSNELEISPQSQTTVAQVQPSQDQTTVQLTKSSQDQTTNERNALRDDETSQEVKEKQTLLTKLSDGFVRNRYKRKIPARRRKLYTRSRKQKHLLSRLKKLCNDPHDHKLCKHDRTSSAESDDELSNDQSLYCLEENAKADQVKHSKYEYKNEKSKSTRKKDHRLDDLLKRAILKKGKFKFENCHFSLNFF